jgi:precorrin-2 dehydrogenase/sirohydrochlorin ferrochelatase
MLTKTLRTDIIITNIIDTMMFVAESAPIGPTLIRKHGPVGATVGHSMYYPVALDLKGRRVVVLGGDEEAARKTETLLACDADVTVVSAAAEAAIRDLAQAGRVNWVSRDYRDGDLDGALLAVACDPACGQRARVEADRRGVLLNVLDQKELCDFIAVATFSRDGLQFGVHSSGNSAVLARRIRERLERQFEEPYADLTRMLGDLRPEVHKVIPSAPGRRRFWLDVIGEDILDRVEQGLDIEVLREEILARAVEFAGNMSQHGQ